MQRGMAIVCKSVAAVLGLLAACAFAADGWEALARPGAIVLFRHATAPGFGDPPGFRLGDCSSQRNLGEQGRAEARAIGEQFRRRDVAVGAVLSSQWCRSRDTARLAFGDRVQEEPAFNSLFSLGPQQREAQTDAARRLLRQWKGPGVLVVVTHQVNISALTGQGTSSGEGVVVQPTAEGPFRVLGTIQP